MAKLKVKIYNDGSQYIANISMGAPFKANYGPKEKDPVYEQFKKYYGEAQLKSCRRDKKMEYIQERFIDDANDIINDVPSFEEIEKMWRRHAHALHLRSKRFIRKASLFPWTWWTTFTYSDKKITADEFEHQLRAKLSDLSSHKGWRFMLRWEEGELYERKHLHAIIYVPEGAMVGEMYLDSHYSKKGGKREIFTNNTYFAKRFGTSYWVKLDDGKVDKSILAYMLKYMSKNDGKIIYSRGIPDYVEGEIDYDTDVAATFWQGFSFKGVLYQKLFQKASEAAESLRNAFNLDECVNTTAIPI